MAHFAQIDESNTVTQVIVVSNDDCGGGDFPSSEAPGQAFIASIGLSGTWKQTSYNGNFRAHYAGIGYTYDAELDAFIAPRPFPSWELDSDMNWQPPVPRPEDGLWMWNEEAGEWTEVTE
jgi:hypothetical protein